MYPYIVNNTVNEDYNVYHDDVNTEDDTVASDKEAKNISETGVLNEENGLTNINDTVAIDDNYKNNNRNDNKIYSREHHRYDLQQLDRVNYQALSNHGEIQLHQVEQEWYKKIKECANKKGKSDVIKIKSNGMLRQLTGIVMNQITKQDQYAQVSVKEGVRRHGQRAIDTIMSEFTQSNNKNIFMPVSPSSISNSDKREALNLITLVKEKRDDKIEGRACADGRKQCQYISKKEEVPSPTVHLHSLLLPLAIDVHECRDVETVDVVGVYLLADTNNFILVKVTWTTVYHLMVSR